MNNRIFRQAVLDRLASPEQLDTVMRVTDARGWIALLACFLLLGAALLWGVLGRVPTHIPASGILIHSAGLADVVAIGAGQVNALEVEVGDHVHKGQVVAEIAQPELVKELEGLRAQLAEQRSAYERSKQLGSQDVELRKAVSAQERASLRSTISATEQRKQELAERLGSQQALFEKGLVTQETVRATRQQLRAAESSVAQMRAEMQRASAESFSSHRLNETTLQADSQRVRDTERQIKLLEERLAQSAKVVSTHNGRVVEVRATVGDVLGPGSPILSLERTGEKGSLLALLYVDSRAGKRIKPGMETQLSPSVVRRERYGVLEGEVIAIEDFPSTRRGMMRVLHNEQLVDTFLAATAGAPIAVRAKLRQDPDTPSGYRWSSGKGPSLELTSGTRCDANITVRSERPIALLLPILEREP